MKMNKKLIAAAVAALCISSVADAASFRRSGWRSIGIPKSFTTSTHRQSVQQPTVQAQNPVTNGSGDNSGTLVSSVGGAVIAGVVASSMLSAQDTSTPADINSEVVASVETTSSLAGAVNDGVPVPTQPQHVVHSRGPLDSVSDLALVFLCIVVVIAFATPEQDYNEEKKKESMTVS